MSLLGEDEKTFPATSNMDAGSGSLESPIGPNDIVLVGAGTLMKAEIRNCRHIEINGQFEGDLFADMVLIKEGGRVYGSVQSDNAEIHGSLYGEADIKNLIDIHSSGSVVGNVKYGQLAIAVGGNLSGELTNVPPALSGDLNLTVEKARSVVITTRDLTAVDPDDAPRDLTFIISNESNGMVVRSSAPTIPARNFTQQELEAGKILFVHDGTETKDASFDVVVKDGKDANSGDPKTVSVTVSS